MPKSGSGQKRIELLQGTLDMLILQTLRWGPQHGYSISHTIWSGTLEVLKVETGSLYPALHRLEKHGWVKSDWKQTEKKQRAKYYSITFPGLKQLHSEHDRWRQLSQAIERLMNQEQQQAAAADATALQP